GSEILKELFAAMEKNDTVNIIEELGDVSWFAVTYTHIWNFNIDTQMVAKIVTEDNSEDIIIHALTAIGHLQELDKNQLAYKREVPGNDINRIKAIHTV